MAFGSDVIVVSSSADTIHTQPDQASTVIVQPDTRPESEPPPKPTGPNTAWPQAAGKRESSARLERLPPGLELDAAVDEPIFYDADRRLLLYRGFMCHGSYVYLRNLSMDLDYLSAVDYLYVRSANITPARRGYTAILAVGAALALAAALGLWRFMQ